MNEQRKLYAAVLRKGRDVVGKFKPVKINIIDFFIVLSIVILLGVVFCTTSHAMAHIPYTEKNAIQTIVGEAADQGMRGMTMVGETIRRRDSLRGCYGFHASHIKNESKQIWIQAKAAWELSKRTNWSNGATGWGSLEDFQNKKWAKGKIIVARYGHQIFYREVRK